MYDYAQSSRLSSPRPGADSVHVSVLAHQINSIEKEVIIEFFIHMQQHLHKNITETLSDP